MLRTPSEKYRPFPPIALRDRHWPSRTLSEAPIWLSTDLRDGNQALFEPMNLDRKLRLFNLLISVGLKEIEIGFPAASKTDEEITRHLINEELIPTDVTPMVMTQLREDLIERTVQSVRGARRVIVHLYNAIAPVWRNIVFGKDVPSIIDMVKHHVKLLRSLTERHPETEWVLQYSPETFCMAELDVSLAVCNAAIQTWQPGEDRVMIINLPTTVEVSTPNVFADQIEWMHHRLECREHVILSVHPHNDRGTGIASAELALLAGAQRIEGCLFGNGERCGNVDLSTLALNLYTQGISPGLDLSDITHVARVVEDCTNLPIHPRHPYAGDLVFTAFSGSHQDAIAKGFAAQRPDTLWQIPYLPIDPKDIGRSYDSIVRVNSQSGKGGIAYLLEKHRGVVMPRRMQVEFSAIVQSHTDASETEMSSDALWQLFERTYLQTDPDSCWPQYHHHHLSDLSDGEQVIELHLLQSDGSITVLHGQGNGPISATVNALNILLRIDSYEERSIGSGADASAVAIIETALPGTGEQRYGVGIHVNISTASILAVLSAARRFSVDLLQHQVSTSRSFSLEQPATGKNRLPQAGDPVIHDRYPSEHGT